jgi:hypothetical protein
MTKRPVNGIQEICQIIMYLIVLTERGRLLKPVYVNIMELDKCDLGTQFKHL